MRSVTTDTVTVSHPRSNHWMGYMKGDAQSRNDARGTRSDERWMVISYLRSDGWRVRSDMRSDGWRVRSETQRVRSEKRCVRFHR